MIARYQKFTLIKSTGPVKRNINEKLQWFGVSVGLFSLRDKDKSCFRVFIELLKASKTGKPLSSDELASQLGLTRGTVIHHLKKLMEAGLVSVARNRYQLRVESLERLVGEIEKDLHRACDDLREVAKDIDAWLNL